MPDIGPVEAKAATRRRNKFYIQRAEAIGDYSDLEQSLCACMAYFGGMSEPTAATIFFKISAARSRSEILDKLKMKGTGIKYSPFWNAALAFGRKLDEERNKIVHWAVAIAIYENDAGELRFDASLKQPNYWTWSEEGSEEIFGPDLEAFSRKCQFLARSLDAFRGFLGKRMTRGEHDTWRDIFQQPLLYPPPPDHPLSQIARGRELRHRSLAR